MYIQEMSPKKYSGTITSLFGIFNGVGTIISAVCGYLLLKYKVEHSWRLLFLIGAFPSLLLAIISICLPESYQWVKKNGKGKEDAMRFFADDADINDYVSFNTSKSGCLGIIKYGKAVTVIALIMACINQLTTPVDYYGPAALKDIGIDEPTLVNIGIRTWMTICALINISDLTGRKPLLLVGLFICGVSFFGIGFAIKYFHDFKYFQFLIVGLFALLLLGYAPGPGNLYWTIVSEIFPIEIKEVGMTLTTVVATAFSSLLGTTFTLMVSSLGQPVTYWIYGGFCFMCFAYLIPAYTDNTRENKNGDNEIKKKSKEMGS